MALWQLYYHLVWGTKARQALITCKRESLYSYVIGKGDILGSIIHAIGGIENHIHLVASIPPTVSIADFVENIKGSIAVLNDSRRRDTRLLQEVGYLKGYPFTTQIGLL